MSIKYASVIPALGRLRQVKFKPEASWAAQWDFCLKNKEEKVLKRAGEVAQLLERLPSGT